MSLLTRWDSDARRAVDVEISPWVRASAWVAAALLSFLVATRRMRRRGKA